MKTATLDILDKEISQQFQSWQDSDFEKRKRNYMENIVLDIPNWKKYHSDIEQYNLQWNEFKYDSITDLVELDQIIKECHTGFYMFIVKPQNAIYDMPKNVFYVGMSGENNSNRPLKERLKDYFHLDKIKKRNAVIRLLQKYYPNVYIAYSLYDANTNILKQIETSLIGFFYPLCNKDDFPIELKGDKKAF
ncbi:hypothetical protein FACS189434_10370 [Bacteroidia bacterium]|nr:hypothetical protein FACS189434_10370 [Bacteroidia bacterium]